VHMRMVLRIPRLNPADDGRGFCQRHADFHINLWHRNAATEELVDVTGNIGEVAKAGDGTKLLAAFALTLGQANAQSGSPPSVTGKVTSAEEGAMEGGAVADPHQGRAARRSGAEGELEASIEGSDLGLLVGPKGQTLLAVQDLTRLVAQRHLGPGSPRLAVDVGGYRHRRIEALQRFSAQLADQVRDSGTPKALEPMTAADRKVVHDALNDRDGVSTISEGEEPYRRVVIVPEAG